MPDSCIVDTNVPLVAAGAHDAANKECQLECVNFISLVLSGSFCLVLDMNGEAFGEYLGNIQMDPPDASLASQFLWYILNNMGYPNRINRVKLSVDEYGEYTTWPQDPELASFDPADRKWVALALAFEEKTEQTVPITYAIDRDWDDHHDALKRCGIILNLLCPKPSVVNSRCQ